MLAGLMTASAEIATLKHGRPLPPLPLKQPAPARLVSLDAFRGATIAGMILVNNPGSWQHIYGPLRHAEWHGATPTDWIFPFFLFIVGVAIPFSQAKSTDEPRGRLLVKIARRSLILFALGMLLASIPTNANSGILNPSTLRIPGVLQRIAVCYFAVATLAVFVQRRAMIAIGVGLLAAYSAAMLWPPADLSRDGNLAHRIDAAILGSHGYKPYNDPEGLLSTLPAIGTVICGWLAGVWLRRDDKSPADRAAALFAFGVIGVVAGLVLDRALMPINKHIWTPSYVVYTAGLACLGLGLFYWLIDLHGYRRWATPMVAMGMNAITIFVLAGIVAKLMAIRVVPTTGAAGKIGLKPYLYDTVFVPSFRAAENASLAWAVCFVAAFTLLALAMKRAKLFIKV
jgi:predicted acyltransferase